MIGHRVEQRVDGRQAVERLALQVLEHRRDVARIGDEDVAAAHAQPQHHVRVESEDVIQRQRADGDHLYTRFHLLHRRLVPGVGLQHVGHEVAMQQHRALADARGAAGVLQHRDVLGTDPGRPERGAAPDGDRVVEAHGAGQVEGRHHLLHAPHHVVDDGALDQAQHVTHGRENHLLRGHRVQHVLQRGGEVLDDDDGLGARVLQLVLELARRVERVHVDHHQARAQQARHHHRVLRHVGHHDRDAIAPRQPQRLRVGRERARQLVDQPEAVVLAHELVCGQIGVLRETGVQQFDQRCVFVRVHMRRHPCWVVLQPVAFHLVSGVRGQ